MKSYRATINGQYYETPARTVEALERYIMHGIRPGSFLQAAISNNFVEVMMRADLENFFNLPALAHFLRWEMPSIAWGSAEKMEAWIKKGGSDGRRTEKTEHSD
jgi:hypothetical protein